MAGSPDLISLVPVLFVSIVPLEILRILFVIEYVTTDLLVGIGVAELKWWY